MKSVVLSSVAVLSRKCINGHGPTDTRQLTIRLHYSRNGDQGEVHKSARATAAARKATTGAVLSAQFEGVEVGGVLAVALVVPVPVLMPVEATDPLDVDVGAWLPDAELFSVTGVLAVVSGAAPLGVDIGLDFAVSVFVPVFVNDCSLGVVVPLRGGEMRGGDVAPSRIGNGSLCPKISER